MSRATLLDDLANSADMVFMHSNHIINTVQASKPTELQPANEIKAMKEMMADLQKQRDEGHSMAEAKENNAQSPATPTNLPCRCRNDNLDIYWYNQMYDDQAKKMQTPLQIYIDPVKLGNRRVTATNSSGDEH